MNLLDLLFESPAWIAVLIVTVALHVAFFLGVRRLMRGEADAPATPSGVDAKPERLHDAGPEESGPQAE
jgi:hypothetical protein